MNCQTQWEVTTEAKATGTQTPGMNSTVENQCQYYLIFSLMVWIVGQVAPSACLQVSRNWEGISYTG